MLANFFVLWLLLAVGGGFLLFFGGLLASWIGEEMVCFLLATALLALAGALLAPFDVLLLDEPFTGLDRENRARALAAIRETAGVRLVLLVTHDAADAEGAPVVRL